MLKSACEIYRYASVDLEVSDTVVERFIQPLEQLYIKDTLGTALYEDMMKNLEKPVYKELKNECKEYLAHLVLYYTSIFYTEDSELQTHLKKCVQYSKQHLLKYLESAKFTLYRKQQYVIP